jgi:hypothetical protein
LCTVGRDLPYHHIDASVRKQAIGELREIEQSLSTIIMQVAQERKYRRLKEFALKAVETQRLGLKREAAQREQKQFTQFKTDTIEKKKQDQQDLLNEAMKVDEKWKENERLHTDEELQKRLVFAKLQFHPGYSKEHPPPVKRQHRKTWRLANFDEHGMPLTLDASNKVKSPSFFMEHDCSQSPSFLPLPTVDVWFITRN